MADDLHLPREMVKNGTKRTADTKADFWNLRYQGFVLVDLTPQQKAALTRAANKAAEEEQATSNVPTSATEPAGDATGDES